MTPELATLYSTLVTVTYLFPDAAGLVVAYVTYVAFK